MKYHINHKIILLATVSSLTFSGCVGKSQSYRSSFNSNKGWKVEYVKANPEVILNSMRSNRTKARSVNRVEPLVSSMATVVRPSRVSTAVVSSIVPAPVVSSTGWKKNISTITKKEEECIDCYATDFSAKRAVKHAKQGNLNSKTFSYAFNQTDFNNNYSKKDTRSAKVNNYYANNSIAQSIESVRDSSVPKASYNNKPINRLNYGAYDYKLSPFDTLKSSSSYAKVTSAPKPIYSSYGMSSGTSIQVGAYKEYANARRVARKYDLLSSNYKVEIKTAKKENGTIYRVRISGFNNQVEAREFMSRYGINNAFLVRR